ncbi:MAG: protein phosphatase 2C domain-containing protein [Lachnospiraceae bacterium]|nr:protein phosphatase 2C domain-containing protein [Lachnospiraceae bacterium]
MKKITQKIRTGVMRILPFHGRESGGWSAGASGMAAEQADDENTWNPPETGCGKNAQGSQDGRGGKNAQDSSETGGRKDGQDFPETGGEEDTLDPLETGHREDTRDGSNAGTEEDNWLLQAVVVNHKGRVRGNNEDNFCLNGIYMEREEMDDGALLETSCGDGLQLYAVCDGMGGAECGEEASYLAVKELAAGKRLFSPQADAKEVTGLLRRISEKIYAEAGWKGKKSGTTTAVMLVNRGRVLFANVGDSRIYRFREGTLTQMSLDHSKVQRMISMGILTAEQAKTDPDRHVITQYLGMPPEIKVSPYFAAERQLRRGDVCLLCSDGLTDMVEENRMEEILQENEDLPEAARRLSEEALNNGGRDNVTVLLVRALPDIRTDKSG